MSEFALPCIACGKPLKNVFTDGEANQPYGGTAFESGGHYGSTIYDAMGGSKIEINVCDTCLLRATDAQRVLEYELAMKGGQWLEPVPWQVDETGRHWVLTQNEKTYGSAWGEDEPYAPAYEEGEEPGDHT